MVAPRPVWRLGNVKDDDLRRIGFDSKWFDYQHVPEIRILDLTPPAGLPATELTVA